MNTIRLFQNITDQITLDTYAVLKEDHRRQYAAEHQKIKPCKSASKKAIEKYISYAMKDKENRGIYTTGTTILLPRDTFSEPENMKAVDIMTPFKDLMKNRRPVDCYLTDSIALYKTLKKQEGLKYHLNIDGNYYNAALVAEMYDCIVQDKKSYINIDLCKMEDSNHSALMISHKGGIAFVLPNVIPCAACEDINISHFFKYIDEIENKYLNDIRKTA